MKQSLLSISLLLFQCFLLQAQEQRLEFNIGIGPPLNAFHAGINLHLGHKLDIGFSAGAIPYDVKLSSHSSIGVESKYKFGESKYLKSRQEIDGKYKKVRLKTWYWGLRATYVKDVTTKDTEKKYVYIIPAIGRHCNFNKALGLNIDFGLAFTALQNTFYEGNRICQRCFLDKHPQYPLLPMLRIQFFAKL